MKASERLLNLKGHELIVKRHIDGEISVGYKNCDIKYGGFLISAIGRGFDFESACADYFNLISGHTLVFNAESSNREEIKVL